MRSGAFPWSKLAAINAEGNGETGTPMTSVNAVVGPDGTLAGQFLRMDTGEIIKVEFGPSGQYSVLQIQGDRWREANISLQPGPQALGSQLTIRTAQSGEGGTVEAKTTTTTLKGHQLTRNLLLEPDGRWTSDYDFTRPDGQRVTGDASSDGGPGSTVVQNRRKLGSKGELLWTTNTESRPVNARTNLGQTVQGNASGSAMIGAIKAWYAAGGDGKGVLSTYDPHAAGTGTGTGRVWLHKVREDPDATREWHSVFGPGMEETVTQITRFHTGETKVESATSELFWDGPLINVRSSETWGATTHVGGAKTTWHEVYNTGPDVSRPDLDPGGEVGKAFHTDTWERSTATPDGKITVERGATTSSAVGESTTKITEHPDGTRTMTTRTTDNSGRGTEHTTTYDKQGRTTSEHQKDVGPSSGSGTGSGSGSGGDSVDGEDTDGDDDSAPLGDEFGPSSAGWGGGREGPLSLLPKHAAGVFGSAIIIDDPLMNPDDVNSQAVPAHMVAGLTHDALVNPGVAYGSESGEPGSSKGLSTTRATSRSTTFLNVVEIPPDEEIVWDNPEVHFTFLTETISALKQAGGLDQASLIAAEKAASQLGAFGARFSTQLPG